MLPAPRISGEAGTMAGSGQSVHLVVSRMARKGGGLHQAVRNRAGLLAESGVADQVWIDVLGFEPRLIFRVNQEKKAGRLHPEVGVRNVLTSLYEGPGKDQRVPFEVPEGLVEVTVGERLTHCLRDGVPELVIQRDRVGVPEWIEHLDPDGTMFRRDDLNRAGRVDRTTEYGADGLPTLQRFLGRDGKPYLEVWMEPGTDGWGRSVVYGRERRTFADSGELYRHALERLIADEPAPVLSSELRESQRHYPHTNADDIVRSVRHPGVRRIAVAHSSHLEPPYLRGADVSPNWQRLLATLDAWDALVVWTEAQREELLERTGRPDTIVAIPPVAPELAKATRAVDPNRLVLVARTHPKKRVDEAMRVFHAVSQRNPDAFLDVFGFGYGDEEEAKVEALIDELGIRSRVHFRGFTKDPGEIYDGAVVTLLTSQSEGLGMAPLESMAHGVPVVAYDANYGPRDIIVEGENGYLVPFGAHDAAAERVLAVMADPSLRARLGEGARRSLGRFDRASHLRRWSEVLRGRQARP